MTSINIEIWFDGYFGIYILGVFVCIRIWNIENTLIVVEHTTLTLITRIHAVINNKSTVNAWCLTKLNVFLGCTTIHNLHGKSLHM